MSQIAALWRRLRRAHEQTVRLVARSERLNARQRDLTAQTGNYLRDTYLGVRPPARQGGRRD